MSILGVAIALHQIPEAFTLGFIFVKSDLTLKMWTTRIIIGGFILASPLGMVLGAVISENAIELGLSIIQSIASGIFVYLGCIDLIVDEFFRPETVNVPLKMKLIKISSILVGWGFIMFVITYLHRH